MMADNNVKYYKYLAYKISKIQWNDSFLQTFETPTQFATGSWDEKTQENILDIWTIPSDEMVDGENDEIVHVCSLKLIGDITAIEFVKDNMLLVSTTMGYVNLIKYDSIQKTMQIIHEWKNLHNIGSAPSPCTSLAIYRGKGDLNFSVATVGGDGNLNFISEMAATKNSKIQKGIYVDSVGINDVKFLNENTISLVNSIGQLKIVDRRSKSSRPQLFNITSDHAELYSLDVHPTRMHMLACGGYDGNLYIVDTRMDKIPATLHTGHSYDLMQVKFHDSFPNNIFTCSGEGSVFHWRCDDLTLTSDLQSNLQAQDFGESKFEIEDLVGVNVNVASPVNSVDVHSNRLLCGGDGGLLTYMDGLFIH